MRNIGGASAESGVDPATIGQPGKYTFCFAELDGVVDWPPLRSQTEIAISISQDAVTLVGVTGTANMIIKATSARELIEMIIKSIRMWAVTTTCLGVRRFWCFAQNMLKFLKKKN